MTAWLVVAAGVVAIVGVLVGTGGLSVRRYSGTHVVAQLVVAGRGLYFSRTPDGAWWQLRMRPCRRVGEDRGGWEEPPSASGVREPRRPLGPGPVAGTAEPDAPRKQT